MTNGSMVLLRGLLRGMGHESACDILARRVKGAGSRSVTYVDCSILSAPSELPDGDYVACFDGHSALACRTRGIWVLPGPAVRDSSADGLESGRDVSIHPPVQEPRRQEAEIDSSRAKDTDIRQHRSC